MQVHIIFFRWLKFLHRVHHSIKSRRNNAAVEFSIGMKLKSRESGAFHDGLENRCNRYDFTFLQIATRKPFVVKILILFKMQG